MRVITRLIALMAVMSLSLTAVAQTAEVEWWLQENTGHSVPKLVRVDPSPYPYDIVGQYVNLRIDGEMTSERIPTNATGFTIHEDGSVEFAVAEEQPEPTETVRYVVDTDEVPEEDDTVSAPLFRTSAFVRVE